MKSSTETIPAPQKNADELIMNISQLMAEAETMLSESSSQHAEVNGDVLRARYEAVENRYAAIKTRFAEAVRRADATVRTNPYETAIIALGVGMLLGACLLGRKKTPTQPPAGRGRKD